MKKHLHDLIFGRSTILSGIVALSIMALIVLGCSCGKNFDLSNLGLDNSSPSSSPSPTSAKSKAKADASKGDVPSDDQLQTLAKTTVLDFNDAIQSGDFSDFHATLSKPFQKQVSAEKLGGVFHEFIDAKVNFKEVKDLDAKFTSTPSVEKTLGYQMLTLKGNYATSPRKTNFELKYIPEGSDWKLSSIDINTHDK